MLGVATANLLGVNEIIPSRPAQGHGAESSGCVESQKGVHGS